MTTLAQFRRTASAAGRGFNAVMRWVANRLTGGYLARLDQRSAEALAAAQQATKITQALHDRFQDQTLAALMLERMSSARAPTEQTVDQAALLRALEDNLTATRMLRDRLQDASLATMVLDRIDHAAGTANGHAEDRDALSERVGPAARRGLGR